MLVYNTVASVNNTTVAKQYKFNITITSIIGDVDYAKKIKGIET